MIGVALAESATAYPYPLASHLRVINDRVGEYPVAVFVDPETRDIKVFLRTPASVPVDAGDVSEVTFERNETGEIVENPFVTIHEVRNGKVSLWRDYWDLGKLMAQAPQWWIEKLASHSAADFS